MGSVVQPIVRTRTSTPTADPFDPSGGFAPNQVRTYEQPAPPPVPTPQEQNLAAREAELAAERSLFEQNQAAREQALANEQAFYAPQREAETAALNQLRNYDRTLDYRYGLAGLETGYSRLERGLGFEQDARRLAEQEFLQNAGYAEDARRLAERRQEGLHGFASADRSIADAKRAQAESKATPVASIGSHTSPASAVASTSTDPIVQALLGIQRQMRVKY